MNRRSFLKFLRNVTGATFAALVVGLPEQKQAAPAQITTADIADAIWSTPIDTDIIAMLNEDWIVGVYAIDTDGPETTKETIE